MEVGIENFLPPGFSPGSELPLAGGDDGVHVDEDGFVQVNRQRRIRRNHLWKLWLLGTPAQDQRVRPNLNADHDPRVWSLGKNDRMRMASGCGLARAASSTVHVLASLRVRPRSCCRSVRVVDILGARVMMPAPPLARPAFELNLDHHTITHAWPLVKNVNLYFSRSNRSNWWP